MKHMQEQVAMVCCDLFPFFSFMRRIACPAKIALYRLGCFRKLYKAYCGFTEYQNVRANNLLQKSAGDQNVLEVPSTCQSYYDR